MKVPNRKRELSGIRPRRTIPWNVWRKLREKLRAAKIQDIFDLDSVRQERLDVLSKYGAPFTNSPHRVPSKKSRHNGAAPTVKLFKGHNGLK